MKIAVCIVSRKRPLPLIAVVMTASRLRSGGHEIDFVIAGDDDDDQTASAVASLAAEDGLQSHIHLVRRPRSSQGRSSNLALESARELRPFAVTMLTDRTIPITPGWDDMVARAAAEQPRRCTWWSSPQDPVCVVPILPTAWLDAADWRWSPEIFPFWYNDIWNQELDLMISGGGLIKVGVNYAGSRGATQRGREFGFWQSVYAATRPLRVEQAKRMAAHMGITSGLHDFAAEFANYDRQMLAGAPAFEERFGDKSDPDLGYLELKARAEAYLGGANPAPSSEPAKLPKRPHAARKSRRK